MDHEIGPTTETSPWARGETDIYTHLSLAMGLLSQKYRTPGVSNNPYEVSFALALPDHMMNLLAYPPIVRRGSE